MSERRGLLLLLQRITSHPVFTIFKSVKPDSFCNKNYSMKSIGTAPTIDHSIRLGAELLCHSRAINQVKVSLPIGLSSRSASQPKANHPDSSNYFHYPLTFHCLDNKFYALHVTPRNLGDKQKPQQEKTIIENSSRSMDATGVGHCKGRAAFPSRLHHCQPAVRQTDTS